MRRDRSQAIVIRNGKILLLEETVEGRVFYSIPGGGIENGETPEQAAVRELEEETNLVGRINRKLSVQYKSDNRGEVHTFLIDVDDDMEPSKGIDPELEVQVITGVAWKSLSELSEIDRMYLWSSGLIRIDEFREEARSWSDEVSYPQKRM